jgi:hypothetical protein
MPRWRAPAETALLGVLLVALTVLLTWPYASRLADGVVDPGDPLFTAWVLGWDLRALGQAPLRLFDANAFHPHRRTLAYSDLLLGLVPLAAFPHLLGASVLLTHNLVLLLTFPLTGLAMFWLVRHLTGHAGAAAVAAVLHAFSHYRFSQLSHLQVLSHLWLPLVLLGLHRLVERGGRWRDACLVAVAITAQALTFGHGAHLAAVATVVFAAWAASPAGRPPLGRALGRGLAASAVAAAAAAPLVVSYLAAHRELGLRRGLEEVVHYAARPTSYLAVPAGNRWLGDLTAELRRPEASLFPGGIALALAGGGLVAAWRRRGRPDGGRPPRVAVQHGVRWGRWTDGALAALLVLALGLVLVAGGGAALLEGVRVSPRRPERLLLVLLGLLALRRLVRGTPTPLPGLAGLARLGWPHAGGYYLLLGLVAGLASLGPWIEVGDLELRPLYLLLRRLLPGFDSLRVPARFGLLVTTAVSVLAGMGTARLARTIRHRGLRAVVLAGLVAGGAVEVWSVPLPVLSPGAPTEADRWLARVPGRDAVVVLPMYPPATRHLESRRLFGSTAHWRPLVNGYSGIAPRDYENTTRTLARFPDSAAVARLRELHVRFVVLHLGQYDDEARAGIEAALDALPDGVTRAATFPGIVVIEVGAPS